jgi:hypothetical protein
MRVKSFTLTYRVDRGLAYHWGRDLVTLAEPKSQHIAAAQARIGHFADAGFFNIENGLAQKGLHGGMSFEIVAIVAQTGLGKRRRAP